MLGARLYGKEGLALGGVAFLGSAGLLVARLFAALCQRVVALFLARKDIVEAAELFAELLDALGTRRWFSTRHAPPSLSV